MLDKKHSLKSKEEVKYRQVVSFRPIKNSIAGGRIRWPGSRSKNIGAKGWAVKPGGGGSPPLQFKPRKEGGVVYDEKRKKQKEGGAKHGGIGKDKRLQRI